ncbi:uncharacterized protein Z520_12067 [Fonsecaea multimorphosa CBS 102226]|uniref:Major facilitator superfamily (MFS) profile domain-containing protein n=1 Tax=Fonsecaea multimorphosa CBS 102226 TaxID=1442371 RepID=A0A0D2I4H8_9EURO|nr:uncharacterized protein Z520_12067 [Fonsecaea multimorphosa CBS 102226]KIX92186.1 hypothetical protein Z520_12067 [Fonsecaea multimorphosa CBS 102226]OAL17562.1 hypothetical protein AYO22_11480 [Fonsecaea multimorphosa]
MDSIHLTRSQVKARIELEEDPHRAALEDNPDHVRVSASTWASVFFLALSFGPPLGLGFLAVASVLQTIVTDLGGSPDNFTWIVGSWSLASAVSFSLAGPLSDVFGRRIPMLAGEVMNILGCIVTGTAQNIPAIYAGQTLIGLGTGVIFVAYAGVPEMLPNKWRSVGLGLLEAGIAIPWAMTSTILAVALTERASWRWILYIAVIVETVALAGTFWFYRPSSRPRGDFEKSRWQEFLEIDFIGLIGFAGGLTTFLIGLTWAGTSGHPWNSAGVIAPIVIGLLVTFGTFAFDSSFSKSPMFPRALFAKFREFSALLVMVFIAGVEFYPMASLLPRGSQYMFTSNEMEIGVISLPNTLLQGVFGVLVPLVSHRVGYVKWQLVFALACQAIFLALSALSVDPNHKLAYMFLPGIGVPLFIWITILSYATASLHVPHSTLGVAMGLVGTFRATGGAVGNAIFNVIFNSRFAKYGPAAIAQVATKNGLNLEQLPELFTATVDANLGIPHAFDGLSGITPAVEQALLAAIKVAYGHAYKVMFLCTLAVTIPGLLCSLCVADPTMYMTNHTQFALEYTGENGQEKDAEKVSGSIHVEVTAEDGRLSQDSHSHGISRMK